MDIKKGRKLLAYLIKSAVFILIIGAVAAVSYITFFFDEINIRQSATKVDPLPQSSTNVLVIGVANGLSDTLMLWHYNPNTDKIDIVSIPRDTYYPREGYNHPAQKKINAVYGSEGADGAVRSIEGLTGIKINYYMIVNYKAVAQIVDAIGGVKVVVPNNMNYDDPADGLHIHFSKGQTVKKGRDIVKLLRWRKNNHGGGYAEGDLGRIEMQQQVLRLGAEKLLSDPALNIIRIQKPILENVRTNMPPARLMYFFSKLKDIKADSINISTIPVTPEEIGGTYYCIVEKDKMEDMLDSIRD